MQNKVVVFWFRRDLRLHDNVGLANALASGHAVLTVFIFDTEILSKLGNKQDRRVDYIHQALTEMDVQLKAFGSGLKTYLGTPMDAFRQIIKAYDVQSVYANRDYEPQAIARDMQISEFLATNGIAYHNFKDQVIFEKSDITKDDGLPYTVYTPYARKWRANLKPAHFEENQWPYQHFHPLENNSIHSLTDIGFERTDMQYEAPKLDLSIIKDYDKNRDFPALQATTQLGIALRFGTISIRQCVAFALQHNDVWLAELIWREFFMQILYHFPKVVHQSFKPAYDGIEWRNNEAEFELWCQGKTGYPIVDAGMRQLNETGFMHNRVRMIVASFLCKHLLIDWRWGEAYFAEKLLDYDLSANNGNWHWAAGTGCDAAPYFRVFNPTIQTQKFDPQLQYIQKWNPEYQLLAPMVMHEYARDRALATYKKGLGEK